MDITLLIGIAAVIFIAGVILIAKGITSEDQSAVPISSPEEIAKLKSTFSPSAVKQSQAKPRTDNMPPNRWTTETEAAGQSDEPLAKMERMLTENAELKKQLTDQKGKFAQLEKKVEMMQGEYDKLSGAGSQKIRELEQEAVRLQQEKEKLLTARELLDELKSKNEVLKRQYDENQRQQAEMRVMISRLEGEKNDLLKMQRAGIDRSELDVMNNRLAGSIATIELLKGENKDLKASCQKLEEALKMSESFNAQLVEKEKRMQYEMAKNRAQALGLEKICEDFKIQIETMSA